MRYRGGEGAGNCYLGKANCAAAGGVRRQLYVTSLECHAPLTGNLLDVACRVRRAVVPAARRATGLQYRHASRPGDCGFLKGLLCPQQTAELDRAEQQCQECRRHQSKFDRRGAALRLPEDLQSAKPHCVSTNALRLIASFWTKPKAGNKGETLRLAVMVTNWPATPPPVQELPQALAAPQLQFGGAPVGQ